jgi:hypothetical protein
MSADTLSALRRWLGAVLMVGLVGTGVELVLLSHYEDGWQLSPLILIAVAVPALILHQAWRGTGTLWLFRWTMVLFVASGLLGVALHFQGAAEFQREMDPSLSTWSLTAKALRAKAPPVLAPGLMAQLGLLGLVFSYRHPASGNVERPSERAAGKGAPLC